jgi:hypothetical protein
LAAKINPAFSGKVANAGTVSVGKLTNKPARIPAISASTVTCVI